MFKIKKGLSLPVAGAPAQQIETARAARSVALLGDDYPGVKPTMLVREGDQVQRGQALFTDKKTAGVTFTAPVAGTVSTIHRGAKRALKALVIDVAEADSAVEFSSYTKEQIAGLSRAQVVENLVASGLWTALRTRPFSKIPALDAVPHSIFVTAIDSNPLCADPAPIITERANEFAAGLDVVARLTEGAVYVCQRPGVFLPAGESSRLSVQEFDGVHPAGLPGTHIHFLDPVSVARSVWFVGYQDIIAFGQLFLGGELNPERVVALGGPGASNPRLLRTTLGVSTDELCAGELLDDNQRVISGSILAGFTAESPMAFLGRYHNQVSVLTEDRERRMIGYLTPGTNRHSVLPIYLSKWLGEKNLQFTTSSNGSTRAMVPVGSYEEVMPLDILPTQLLRALLTNDLELAINLGCLELDEEDVAPCTYACPGKYEYGPVLRHVLTQIEKEG